LSRALSKPAEWSDGMERRDGLALAVEGLPSVYDNPGGESTKLSDSDTCWFMCSGWGDSTSAGTAPSPGVAVVSDGEFGTLKTAVAINVLDVWYFRQFLLIITQLR
jgi:hypothetical protein